jgi:hypothetical protein
MDHPNVALVQFDYRLRISDSAGALDSITIAMRNLSDRSFHLNTTLVGTPGTTGFDDYATGHYSLYVPMWAGTFAFDVGCMLTADAVNKNGDCWIDNVNITTINTTYQDVATTLIGNHSAGGSLNWSVIDFPRQMGINLSCYAVDNGSLLPSNTYHPNVNLSIGDIQKPRVLTPIPAPGSVFLPNVIIEVGVTATDNTGIDKAIANITYPNGVSTLVPLTYMPQYDKYNASFITPTGNNGNYTIVFIINDTSNNINSSTTTWFQVVASLPPAVTLLFPPTGANATTTSYNFSWRATDSINGTMACNLTINSVVNQSFVSSANNTPANRSVNAFVSGRYHWNVSCYDGTGWNTSETRVFTVDNGKPWLDTRTESPTSPAPYGTISADFSVNASDALNAIDQVWFFINSTRYSATKVGDRYNITVAGLASGTYYYNWSVNDTLGNTNTTSVFQYTISSYSFVPVLSFTLTLPGQAAVVANSSQNGTTGTMFFNSTSNTFLNMNPCVQGTSFCQSGSTPFFTYMNTGTLNLTLSVFLESALPAVFQLKANVTNASVNASVVSTSAMMITRNMTPNMTQPLWFFGDFINAFPNDSTVRNLTSEGK